MSVYLWYQMGFFIHFQHEKYLIGKEIKGLIKKSVPKNKLFKFTFTKEQKAQLIWHKPKEFELNGHFYDIVYSQKDELGNDVYECISDDQETVLFQKLDDYIAKNLGEEGDTGKSKSYMKCLQTPVEQIESHKLISYSSSVASAEKAHFKYIESFSNEHLLKLIQPPDYLS
jgi:hypothetical protein